jgi:hypothetical protein
MKKILYLLLFLIFNSAYALNGEEFYYTKEAINALADVNYAVTKSQEIPTGNAKQQITRSMQALIKQKNAMIKAKYQFEKFTKSNTEIVKQSAVLISSSLSLLQSNLETAITLNEQILNMSDKEVIENNGTINRKLAECIESTDDAWDAYSKTSMSITYTLTAEGKDPNAKITHLKLTRKEIDELKGLLKDRFKYELSNKTANKLRLSQYVPIYLMQFLNDKWKAVDEI